MACIKSSLILPSLIDYTCKLRLMQSSQAAPEYTPLLFNILTSPLVRIVPLLIWSSVELSVVIMACSIPFLRLLSREIQTRASKSGSNSGGTHSGYNLDNVDWYRLPGQASNIHTHVQAGSAPRTADDSSERSILGEVRKKNHIMRTDMITVETLVTTKQV